MRSPTGGRRHAPLIGRAHERALLAHLLLEADAGRSSIVVTSGVAGAGKSALVRWLGTQARERGGVVLSAAAGDELAPGALFDRLLRPLMPATGSVVPPVELLVGTARRRLLVLSVDDAHQLERSEAAALADVLAAVDESWDADGLRLLVSIATREPIEAGGLAARALRLDATRSLPLGGLDEHELYELFQAFGERPDPAVVARLLEDTGGLPLLVGATLEEMARARQVGSDGARQDVRVRTVADAISPRLRSVDAGVLAVLRVAAVLGDPWDPDELAAVTERSSDQLWAALDAAGDAGLVLIDAGRGRFAHPLVRAELLRPLGEGARRQLHRTVADRLLSHEPAAAAADELAVRIAGHLIRARPAVPAEAVARHAWDAGRIALRAGAWHRASQLLEAAAAAHEESGGSPADLAARYLEAAKAGYLDEDPDRCEQAAAAALSHVRAAAADGDAGARRVRLESAVVLVRNRSGRALAPGGKVEVSELEQALAGAGDASGGELAGAGVALAEALLLSGERERAFDLIEIARRQVVGGAGATAAGRGEGVAGGVLTRDPLGDDLRFRIELVEGLHRLAALELVQAQECFERAQRHASDAGNDWSELTARSRDALTRLVRGSVPAAVRELAAAEERAAGMRLWGEAALAAANHAFAAVLAGRHDADAVVNRALRLYRRAGTEPAAVALAPAAAALAARRGGDDVLRAAGALAPAFSRSSLCAVLSAVEAGDTEAVRASIASASWRHGLIGPVTLQNQGIPVALAMAGDVLGDPGMVALAEPALDVLYEAGAVVALGWPALVPRLLALCRRIAGHPDQAVALVDHAVTVCDRADLPAETAFTRLEQARVVAAMGARADEVRSLVTDALRRFDALGLHGWVARAEGVAHDLRLGAFTGIDAVARERTILTTDIVGSTEANARLGDALYVEQLRVHDRLVRARLRECNGVEIKHTGDGINAVFDDPANAVRAALSLQADLDRWHSDEPDLALRVRCGLARGRVIPSGGDFFGLVQSEAARLCALAGAGDVLGSERVVKAAAQATVGFVAESLGTHHLRGLPEATDVYRLAVA